MPPLKGNSIRSSLRSLKKSAAKNMLGPKPVAPKNRYETPKPDRLSSFGITPSWVYLESESERVILNIF
jgi:hypothetical protein